MALVATVTACGNGSSGAGEATGTTSQELTIPAQPNATFIIAGASLPNSSGQQGPVGFTALGGTSPGSPIVVAGLLGDSGYRSSDTWAVGLDPTGLAICLASTVVVSGNSKFANCIDDEPSPSGGVQLKNFNVSGGVTLEDQWIMDRGSLRSTLHGTCLCAPVAGGNLTWCSACPGTGFFGVGMGVYLQVDGNGSGNQYAGPAPDGTVYSLDVEASPTVLRASMDSNFYQVLSMAGTTNYLSAPNGPGRVLLFGGIANFACPPANGPLDIWDWNWGGPSFGHNTMYNCWGIASYTASFGAGHPFTQNGQANADVTPIYVP